MEAGIFPSKYGSWHFSVQIFFPSINSVGQFFSPDIFSIDQLSGTRCIFQCRYFFHRSTQWDPMYLHMVKTEDPNLGGAEIPKFEDVPKQVVMPDGSLTTDPHYTHGVRTCSVLTTVKLSHSSPSGIIYQVVWILFFWLTGFFPPESSKQCA